MGNWKKPLKEDRVLFEHFIKNITSVVKYFKTNTEDTESLPERPQIIIDPRIEAMYQAGIRDKVRQCAIREIVVHGTAGGSTMASLVDWMLGGEQAANYNRGIGLFHYAIGRDGNITQVITPRYWVYHSLSGAHDQETVGVELINPDRGNGMPYTESQYVSLASLCDWLMRQNKDCRQIVSHNHNGLLYSRQGKSCPGYLFDWPRLVDSLIAHKWSARIIAEEVIRVA